MAGVRSEGNQMGVVLGVVAAFALYIFWGGYVAATLWGWFVVPLGVMAIRAAVEPRVTRRRLRAVLVLVKSTRSCLLFAPTEIAKLSVVGSRRANKVKPVAGIAAVRFEVVMDIS